MTAAFVPVTLTPLVVLLSQISNSIFSQLCIQTVYPVFVAKPNKLTPASAEFGIAQP